MAWRPRVGGAAVGSAPARHEPRPPLWPPSGATASKRRSCLRSRWGSARANCSAYAGRTWTLPLARSPLPAPSSACPGLCGRPVSRRAFAVWRRRRDRAGHWRSTRPASRFSPPTASASDANARPPPRGRSRSWCSRRTGAPVFITASSPTCCAAGSLPRDCRTGRYARCAPVRKLSDGGRHVAGGGAGDARAQHLALDDARLPPYSARGDAGCRGTHGRTPAPWRQCKWAGGRLVSAFTLKFAAGFAARAVTVWS